VESRYPHSADQAFIKIGIAERAPAERLPPWVYGMEACPRSSRAVEPRVSV